MRSLLFLSIVAVLILAVGVYAQEPVFTESSPAPNSEYTSHRQYIPYRVVANYREISEEMTRRGMGGQTTWRETFHSADDPSRVFTFNEMSFRNRAGMDPYGIHTFEGDIISKHLEAGNYIINLSIGWRYGAATPDNPLEWRSHEIPIRITGTPELIPEPSRSMNLVEPAGEARTRRYPVGEENSFSVNVRLEGEGRVSMFGQNWEIRQIENPDLELNREQVNFLADWMGSDRTTGTLQIYNLPVGHYELVVRHTWRERGDSLELYDEFEYTESVSIPFEVFDPANDHFVVERRLPRNPVVPGVVFPARLLVDPRSDELTGIIVTENLPTELELISSEPEPETTNPLVWLFRHAESIPFTEVVYNLRVREGTEGGTIINMDGVGEVLGQESPIGGHQTITVVGLNLDCPVPNQVLLGHIDNWGRFVRDDLRPDDPIMDDLTILQVIERWRSCLRV